MPNKELTNDELKAIVAAKMDDPNTTAADILSTILDALQEPTERMVDVVPVLYRCGRDWRQDAKATYRAMLNASPLGEQSE